MPPTKHEEIYFSLQKRVIASPLPEATQEIRRHVVDSTSPLPKIDTSTAILSTKLLLRCVTVQIRRRGVGTVVHEPLQTPGRAIAHGIPGRRLSVEGLRAELPLCTGLEHVHVAVHTGLTSGPPCCFSWAPGNVGRAPAQEVGQTVKRAVETGVGIGVGLGVQG